MRDNTAQGLTLETTKAWKGRNCLKTCLNGGSEKSIGIYGKSKCQWSCCLIDLEPRLGRYGRLKLQEP